MNNALITPGLTDVVWVDLDDTLIDFRANSKTSLRLLYEATPAIAAVYPSTEAWIEAYMNHNYRLWALYNNAEISRDDLRLRRFMLPLLDAGMPEAEARRLAPGLDPAYLDLLAQQKRLVDGAIPLLERLRAAGLTIGCLSNGFKEVQYRKITNAGLDPYIDVTVLSDDIGVNKPDIRLYRHAMERVGNPRPERHMMIGDNPATDIAGALAAGWQAILFDPLRMLTAPAPARTVHALDEITPAEITLDNITLA